VDRVSCSGLAPIGGVPKAKGKDTRSDEDDMQSRFLQEKLSGMLKDTTVQQSRVSCSAASCSTSGRPSASAPNDAAGSSRRGSPRLSNLGRSNCSTTGSSVGSPHGSRTFVSSGVTPQCAASPLPPLSSTSIEFGSVRSLRSMDGAASINGIVAMRRSTAKSPTGSATRLVCAGEFEGSSPHGSDVDVSEIWRTSPDRAMKVTMGVMRAKHSDKVDDKASLRAPTPSERAASSARSASFGPSRQSETEDKDVPSVVVVQPTQDSFNMADDDGCPHGDLSVPCSSVACEQESGDSSFTVDLLLQRKFFKDLDLSSEVLRELPQIAKMVNLRQGSVIFRHGDMATTCYIVVSGVVGIYVPKRHAHEDLQDDVEEEDEDRQRLIRRCEPEELGELVSTMPAGALFGEVSLLKDLPRLATARCMDKCTLVAIEKDGFDRLLKADLTQRAEEKVTFLQEHVPGMGTSQIAARPRRGRMHATYHFQHRRYPKGHVFARQDTTVTPYVTVVVRGEVSMLRSAHDEEGKQCPVRSREVGRTPKNLCARGAASNKAYRSLSRDPSRERLCLSTPVSSTSSRAASPFRNNLNLARQRSLSPPANKVCVLVRGCLFGSMPFPETEPFTVVASTTVDVYEVTTGMRHLPRAVCSSVSGYIAETMMWRLNSHNESLCRKHLRS